MINPNSVCLWIPRGLQKFKLALFERIGQRIIAAGGSVVRDDEERLGDLPETVIPIVGCTPTLRPYIESWQRNKRTWCYWDRGYLLGAFLPLGFRVEILAVFTVGQLMRSK